VAWPWEIVERDHEVQNPTSAEKIRLLGDYLRLTSESRVLDVACGKGGPAVILASTIGCRIQGVEVRPAFADEARRRVAASGLESLVQIETADAKDLQLEPEAWDSALCLGASFIWGTIADTATALLPCVRAGGFVAIGEPFWRHWPLSQGVDGGRLGPVREPALASRGGVARRSAGLLLPGRRRRACPARMLPERLPPARACLARLGDLRRAQSRPCLKRADLSRLAEPRRR
jgi:SAM-dependent methyltransferase